MPHGNYNDIPDTHGGRPQETPGGKMRREPHPNGGEVARVDVPMSKMPEDQSANPIHHTSLNTDLGKMPRQMSGALQRDPHRR